MNWALFHSFIELLIAFIAMIACGFFFFITFETIHDVFNKNIKHQDIWIESIKYSLSIIFGILSVLSKIGIMVNSSIFSYERLTGRVSGKPRFSLLELTITEFLKIVIVLIISLGCSIGDAYLNYISVDQILNDNIAWFFFFCNLLCTWSILFYGTIDTIFELTLALKSISKRSDSSNYYKDYLKIIFLALLGKAFNYWIVKDGLKKILGKDKHYWIVSSKFLFQFFGFFSIILFGLAYSRSEIILISIEGAPQIYITNKDAVNSPDDQTPLLTPGMGVEIKKTPYKKTTKFFSFIYVIFLTYLAIDYSYYPYAIKHEDMLILGAIGFFSAASVTANALVTYWTIKNEISLLPHNLFCRLESLRGLYMKDQEQSGYTAI